MLKPLTTNDKAERYFMGKSEHLIFMKLVNEGQMTYDDLYSHYCDVRFGRHIIKKLLCHKVIVKGAQVIFYLPPQDR